MIPRPYQRATIDAIYAYLRKQAGHPCAVLPTGSGKTLVMSTIANDAVTKWGGRVLVLAHVKELLSQTAANMAKVFPGLDVGVYSAGLGSRDIDHPVIVAGIQSVYQRACELGRFDLIMVDEAHLIPPDGDGMYQSFLADARLVNPDVRLVGLTATPYRMKSGVLIGPNNLLTDICYEVGVNELITGGYLCPLKSKAGKRKVNTSCLHVRGGEFVAKEVDQLMDTAGLVDAACRELVEMTADRKSVLIFAASVAHAEHVRDKIEEVSGYECGLITGTTPSDERAKTIARFHGEKLTDLFGEAETVLKYLVNVNVLTTGFDAPNVDCVALLRPTASPGLYYQMVGRGFRLHPGKDDCLVLDYGENIVRHGPVDAIRPRKPGTKGGGAPVKECPQCQTVTHSGYSACPDCGYEWPEASGESPLSGEAVETEYPVRDVRYSVHTRKGADESAPKTMRVDYVLSLVDTVPEWVCFEHGGFAGDKAAKWWKEHSNDPMPVDSEAAVMVAENGGVAVAEKITIVPDGHFDRVVGRVLGPIPEYEEVRRGNVVPEDEIPF